MTGRATAHNPCYGWSSGSIGKIDSVCYRVLRHRVVPKKYSEMLHLRVTKEQMRALALRAAADNRSISDWLRPHLDRLVEAPESVTVEAERVQALIEPEVTPVPEPSFQPLPTGVDTTITVAPDGGGSSTEGDDLASLLAEMEDFSPDV